MQPTLGRLAMHAARAYIRHAPTERGKHRLYERVSWRSHLWRARTVDGIKMIGTTDSTVDRYVWYFGQWEPAHTAWLKGSLRPGDGMLDVGAHSGYYSLLAARLVGPTGQVTAVEASPATFALLERNIALNRAANVRSVHCAAAREVGELAFYGHPDPGRSGTRPREELAVEAVVPARPLTDVLSRDDWRRVRIVKVDIEGAEPEALAGLAPYLADARPDCEILLELNATVEAETAVAEMLATLAAHGFHAYQIQDGLHPSDYIARGEPDCTGARVHPTAQDRGQMDLVFSRRDAPMLHPAR